MRVLAIESCGLQGGVALAEEGVTLGETIFESGMVHGRDIAPSIDALCRSTGVALGSVDLVAVDVGPGSYTGLRVGIAAAKGLCLALGKPAAAVASLDALAVQVTAELVAAVLDAKWDQVYGALYEKGRRTTEFLAEAPDAFARRVPPGATVTGDALRKHAGLFAGRTLAPRETWWPRPSTIARLAAVAVDARTLVPLYLRPTEAEVKFGSKK
jgi:tRNA threonylcarbamoyladenosine biosynthesis protein TsaB